MDKGIIMLCQTLAILLQARYRVFDPVTSALLVALADFVGDKATPDDNQGIM